MNSINPQFLQQNAIAYPIRSFTCIGIHSIVSAYMPSMAIFNIVETKLNLSPQTEISVVEDGSRSRISVIIITNKIYLRQCQKIMNINTMLQCAKYVISGSVVDSDKNFQRRKSDLHFQMLRRHTISKEFQKVYQSTYRNVICICFGFSVKLIIFYVKKSKT